MKYIKKTLTIALCLAFALGFMMASGLSIQKAYAADYTYKIKVYSGKEGYFNDDPDKHEVSVTASYGDKVTIDIYNGEIKVVSKAADGSESESTEDIKLSLVDSEKYYVRGVKISGHDNAEVAGSASDPPTFTVDSDASYAVVYGMAGGMVKYVVNYVDEDGAALAPSGEFYGMIGDKPVVSYKYIEGYLPQAYNLGKTLTGDPIEDVFTFTYSENTGETTVVVINGGGAGGAGGAGGTGVNIADNDTPTAGPADYVDLDDNQTPTTDGTGADGTDIDDNKTPGVNWPVIGGGAVLLLGIAVAALAFVRRRKTEEE